MKTLNFKKVSLLFLLLMTFCLVAKTQENSLTYDEAINIALRENLQILQEQNTLKSINSAKLASIGQYLPSIHFQAVGERSFGRQFDQTTGNFTSQAATRGEGGMRIGYTLFNGMARINTLKQTKVDYLVQNERLSQTKQDVIFTVSNLYLQVLLNEELLIIAQQNLQEQAVLLESIEEFVKAGIRNITDEYNQKAEVKRLTVNLIDAERNLITSKTELINMLQLDPLQTWHFAKVTANTDDLLLLNFSEQEEYQQMVKFRADLQAQKLQIKSFYYATKASKAGYIPSLNLYYDYYSRYSSLPSNSNEEVRSFKSQVTEINPVEIFSITLNVPIFDQFKTKALVQERKYNWSNEKLKYENLKRQAFLKLQTAIINFRSLQQSVISSKVEVAAAEKALEAENERFRLGIGQVLDLNRANTRLVAAKSNLVQAKYTLKFQKVVLDYNRGTLSSN